MTDKKLVLGAIRRLPKSATLQQIRKRVNFLVAVRKGEESLSRGNGITHEEVEKQFMSWVKNWPERQFK